MIRQSDNGAGTSSHVILNRFRTLLAQVLRRLGSHAPSRLQKLAISSQIRVLRRWPSLSGWIANSLAGERTAPVGERAGTERPPSVEETAALIATLRDPSAEVAIAAAQALARHPLALAAPALRTVIDNEDGYFCASTRLSAVQALNALLPPGNARIVAGAIRDIDPSVSVAAILALVEHNDKDCEEVLLSLLEDSTGFYVALTRRAAAHGLARLGQGHSGRVTALLQRESDPEVRAALAAG